MRGREPCRRVDHQDGVLRQSAHLASSPWGHGCGLRAAGETTMPTGRVLIVDDDRANALDLQQRVTQLGYTVLAIAVSGQEALAQAAAGRPDVVVMELRLRGLVDGIQAGTLIWVQFGIPVIYVSAQVTAPTFQRLWPTAPVGLLGKHVGMRDLGKAVEDVLGRRVPIPVDPAGRRRWPPHASPAWLRGNDHRRAWTPVRGSGRVTRRGETAASWGAAGRSRFISKAHVPMVGPPEGNVRHDPVDSRVLLQKAWW